VHTFMLNDSVCSTNRAAAACVRSERSGAISPTVQRWRDMPSGRVVLGNRDDGPADKRILSALLKRNGYYKVTVTKPAYATFE